MLKISSTDNNVVSIFESKVDLSNLEGFKNLTIEQKKFVIEYANNYLEKHQSAINLNIPYSTVKSWFDKDNDFSDICQQIKEIYAEKIMSRHLIDSINNSKIRTGTLKALNHDMWKEEKKSNNTNILIAGDEGIKNLIEKI